MELSGETVLDDLVTRYPSTAGVFIRRRMQCVGCEVARFETLASACQIYGQALGPLLEELRVVVAAAEAAAPLAREPARRNAGATAPRDHLPDQ